MRLARKSVVVVVVVTRIASRSRLPRRPDRHAGQKIRRHLARLQPLGLSVQDAVVIFDPLGVVVPQNPDALVSHPSRDVLETNAAGQEMGGEGVPEILGEAPAERQARLAASIPGAEVFEVDGDHSACISRADLFVPALIAACHSVERRMSLI
jgi:hypothetical protein